ncbi:MAG: Fe-S cluster assembly protein SufD [Proteobacteria bacterium]|nr:Fe-S cluster assembly protein SufD [Pseudomonadota bacterium]
MNIALPAHDAESWKYTNLALAVKGMPQEAVRPPVSVRGGAYVREEKDGWVIDVPSGERAAEPSEIAIRGFDNSFFMPRMDMRLGAGAALSVIERHEGRGRFWNNQQTQIAIGAGAVLRHIRLQENPEDAIYTQNTNVTMGKGGRYEVFTLTTGSLLSRNEMHVDLNGEGASCALYGVNLLRGKQHGDSTLTVVHAAPGCRSEQFYRSLLRDQAHGVYQGKILVARGADGTDATQLSNAILLSEGAEMDTKPELEIYADDVKCSHGATTGALDEEALFYMRSRGVDEDEARAVLLSAFVNEVAEKAGDGDIAEMFRKKIHEWLARGDS